MSEIRTKSTGRQIYTRSSFFGRLPYTRINFQLFGLGMIFLVLGYISLSIGPWDSFWSLTLAPILLVLGYVVILPIAFLYQARKKETKS